MINEIIPGIFRLTIPLPGNPLRSTNAYVIKGEKRSLLIDTGFNWRQCKEALLAGVENLGLKWPEVDFFITHVHGDHSGLVYAVADAESTVYCSRTDADLMREVMTIPYWQKVNSFFTMHGFPANSTKNQAETISNFISGADLNFCYVDDGYTLEFGDYQLVCTSTPGHTPGHMCLYEPRHKFLLAGDHILAGISSNITAWTSVEDSLGQYLHSLEKVAVMDINLVLPGHRSPIGDHRSRIAELRQHHHQRLQEVCSILAQWPMNAYQVAGRMLWDINYQSWDLFPPFQQWFATGEAIAHLDHLVQKNELKRLQTPEAVLYQRTI